MKRPSFQSYGEYRNAAYGLHCLVFTDASGNDFYYSYKTLVAFRTIRSGLVCIKNYWGPTTGKHLNWIQRDKKARVDQETFDRLYAEYFPEEAKNGGDL